MDEEILTGGGVNRVVRVGETVRRPTGPWTPAVHALLDHLDTAGFDRAPKVHGVDQNGREVLDFVPGQVGFDPAAEGHRDARLYAVARLIRAFHAATAGYSAPAEAIWYFPPRSPTEVICHGDLAPYNMVFHKGLPVALIDFDTAHPGPRIWDVAYAAYRFVPLTLAPGQGAVQVAEQARRLRLFVDAYELAEQDRAALVATAITRLKHLVAHMEEQATAGNEAFAAHLRNGHHLQYRTDAEHLARHSDELTGELKSPLEFR